MLSVLSLPACRQAGETPKAKFSCILILRRTTHSTLTGFRYWHILPIKTYAPYRRAFRSLIYLCFITGIMLYLGLDDENGYEQPE